MAATSGLLSIIASMLLLGLVLGVTTYGDGGNRLVRRETPSTEDTNTPSAQWLERSPEKMEILPGSATMLSDASKSEVGHNGTMGTGFALTSHNVHYHNSDNKLGHHQATTASDHSYNELPQSGYCRTSSNDWHCWLSVDLDPLTQEGCSLACTGLSTCTAYTYDSQKTYGYGCYLSPTSCVQSSGNSVNQSQRGPWSLEGPEACTRGSINPTSAQTYLKQASLVYGLAGSNECPHGSAAIADWSTCKALSEANGLVWSSEGSWSTSPHGCKKDVSGTTTWFNLASGQGNQASQVICTNSQAWHMEGDTKDCMDKVFCYGELPQHLKDNLAWKCDCVWTGTRSERDWCDVYNQCLEEQGNTDMHEQMDSMERAVLGRAPASFLESQDESLLQSGACAGSIVDDSDCVDPFDMTIEEVECDCWAEMKASCGNLPRSQQVACYRRIYCTDPRICRSWQCGQCSDAERSSFLEVQGTRVAAVTFLVDILQGRKQPPGNISSFAPADLEQSLGGKAGARSCR